MRGHNGAGGARPCRGQSRGMQNSQRVLLTKPRTAPMARRRDRDIAPYRQAARVMRTATGRTPRDTGGTHGHGTMRRDRDIAPYRQAARGGARRGRGEGQSRAPRRWRGGAIGTSRPTAKQHGRCARPRDAATVRGRCDGARGDGARAVRRCAWRRCAWRWDTSGAHGHGTAKSHGRFARATMRTAGQASGALPHCSISGAEAPKSSMR